MDSEHMLRLFWTVRHLRPHQIWGRATRRLIRHRVDGSPPPPLRAQATPWPAPPRRARRMTGPRSFDFLGEPGDLSEGWTPHGRSHLWLYNLHYFEDLLAEGAESRRDWHQDLIADWIASNPPASEPGWEPYPTSLRLCAWIQWARSVGELPEEADASLAIQARWIACRIEHHLSANHLFVNAKALCLAGLHFDGPEADGWLAQGLGILRREASEQILSDGGQYERSPMYHVLAVVDALDLVAAETALSPNKRGLRDLLEPRLPAMLAWMRAMTHPDGEVAFFNDSAIGPAPTPEEVLRYAKHLGIPRPEPEKPVHWMRETGYARLVTGPAVLLVDMAPVGPDHQPGHAHADTLSFELSLFGRRVVVNSGTSVYGVGPERMRQRSTPAHSTVTVAGADSSEVWSGFRVARRARVFNAAAKMAGSALVAGAVHDGYRRLAGGPFHRRDWRLTKTSLCIEDRLDGELPADARIHLHPDVSFEGGVLRLPGERTVRCSASAPVRAEPSSYHPAFGVSMPSTCLVLPVTNGAARLELDWS